MDDEARALFREAEVRAERILALLRMTVAVILWIAFTIAVLRTAPDADAMLDRQFIFAHGTIVAYFVFGAVSHRLARRRRFPPWASWVFATADVLFVAANTHSSIINTGFPANYAAGFPAVWLAPVVLAFGALRYNPFLQAWIAVLVTAGVVVLIVSGDVNLAPVAETPAGFGFFFGLPPNVMRGVMVVLAGGVLVVAAVRARRLLLSALAEQRRLANLTRYLPPQIAGRLADNGAAELRAGRRQDVAVLFCDIRGFTHRAEALDPAALTAFVARFRAAVIRAAESSGGVVDKFVGDGAMILFGVPDSGPGDAAAALACARILLVELAAWNRARGEAGPGEPVRVGIGVHWGPVYCGAVGDDSRLEFTVLGDTVNVAARLEQLTKDAGVPLITTAETLAAAGEAAGTGWALLPDALLRGRSRPVRLYGWGGGAVPGTAPATLRIGS